MSVLIIRAHKRFAVRSAVRVRHAAGPALSGLLIEASLEGCRVSGVDSRRFAFNDEIEMEIAGWTPLLGLVRWAHSGMIGLKLVKPLHNGELNALLAMCRSGSHLAESKLG